MLSPEHRIESMIEITERLTGLLEEEVGLLRQMKVSQIANLQDAKMRLTEAYQARVEEIQKNAEKYKNVSSQLKQKLAKASTRFKDAVMKDMNAINAAKIANERVVEAIAEVILDRQQAMGGYNARGGAEKVRRSYSSLVHPVAMSESL